MVKWINKRTFFSFFSFFVLVQTWQNILDNGVKGFAPFIIFKSFPPWSRSSSSCVGLYLHGQCLSPRRTLCQRPYSALTLDTSACVRPSAQRVIDVWAKPSALLCSRSGLKIAWNVPLADYLLRDDLRARVGVMATPPWLFLLFLLCWTHLGRPAYQTHQTHQVKKGHTFQDIWYQH